MGFEIPVDVDFDDHPKTVLLIRLIGKTADAYPQRLWRWAAKYARTGFVAGGADQIEGAVKWTGERGKLHAALVESGFIEPDGKTIHDWQERAGRAIQVYERKKEKQRIKYAEENGILPAENGRIPPIQDNQDVQDRTRNSTQDKKSMVLGIAQKAAFAQGRGSDPRTVAEWNVLFLNLEKAGVSLDLIETEVDRNGRDTSEKPWEFKKRLIGENNAKPVDPFAGFRPRGDSASADG